MLLHSTEQGHLAWPDTGSHWILSADSLDCTQSGPQSRPRTLNRSVCHNEARAPNCTDCHWFEAQLEWWWQLHKKARNKYIRIGLHVETCSECSRLCVNILEENRKTKTNRGRVTLVDKVKASSWLATLSIEPQHDLIGSCQWQCLSWNKRAKFFMLPNTGDVESKPSGSLITCDGLWFNNNKVRSHLKVRFGF